MDASLCEADTLPALLARTVAAHADRPAVTEGARTLDWRGFAAEVERVALGAVRAGDRVALWLPSGIRYLAAIFAVAARGAVAIHVNPRFGAAEVADLFARARPAILITEPALTGAVLAQLDAVPPPPDGETAPPRPVAVAAADDCLTYTTGGTTAQPKLVVHTHDSIARHAAAVAARLELDAPDAAYLAIVPLCGTFGNIGALAAVAGGAHIVLQPAFDPAETDALIRRHRITHTLADDRTVLRLAEAAAGPHALRFCGTAAFGADAAPALAAAIAAGLNPRAIYGSSEVQALYAIGAAAEGAVVPVDSAARFAIVEGELRLDGPSRFDRYLDDPAATAAAQADGLFRTGDRARTEGDGFVFEGRMGDALRLGGFLVSPREIEAFLCTQPGVAEAQVVGVETERGLRAFAFAIPTAGFNEAALLAAAAQWLARYKVPARVVALDAFPTVAGPNGAKISRAELRRLAAEHIAARPKGMSHEARPVPDAVARSARAADAQAGGGSPERHPGRRTRL